MPKEIEGDRDHPDLQRILWGKHIGEVANDSPLLNNADTLLVPLLGEEGQEEGEGRRSTAISGLPTSMDKPRIRISDGDDGLDSPRGGGGAHFAA